MDLVSVLYVSSMCIVYTDIEMAYIVEKFQKANKLHNITGMLVYSNGNVMQYIEGSKNDIENLYKNIKSDPMHTNIITLLYENTESRIFPDWCLNYKVIKEDKFNEIRNKEDNRIKIKMINNFIKCNRIN